MRYRFLVTRLLYRANPASTDFAEAFAVAREATEHFPQHAPAWDLVARAGLALARQALTEGRHAAEAARRLEPNDRKISQRLMQFRESFDPKRS
ncbi:hypothetical protein Thiowin_04219 [Thiorhodovibrio winogradskyi]|uniref:Uncharacterized protein n=1 Tax=Thiorhodovibrio winogradskyi TaxID=77007 RepID=A0ABZ0SDK4_9GAMM|nr:hypothetical protein [Thiorhodovibrio winogradskyi]